MNKMTLTTEGETHVIVNRYLRSRSGGHLPSAHRAWPDTEMDARPGRLDHACLFSEAKPGAKTPLRGERRQGRGFLLDGRVSGIGTTTAEIVHIERMHLTDPTPDNHLETRFDGDGNGTLITTH